MCVLHGQGKRVLLLAHLPKVGGCVSNCVCVFEGSHQSFVYVCAAWAGQACAAAGTPSKGGWVGLHLCVCV